MDNDYLDSLKDNIIKELDPIMVDDSLSPEERFGYYLTIASSTQRQDALEKAFTAAKLIEDSSQKAEALMNLLDLVSELQELTINLSDSSNDQPKEDS